MCAMHNCQSSVATEVLKRGPAQFAGWGEFLGYPLHEVDEVISQGLAQRLVAYAKNRLIEAGFDRLVEGWTLTVYTINGDDRPADRSYCVRWKSEKGGFIEVVGILTRSGWPTLDHGFEIGEE
jgi:hypothetical protein